MESSQKFVLLLLLGVLGVVSTVEGKTVVSSSPKSKTRVSDKPLELKPENALLRLAKSVVYEAINEFREEGRRNPKLGMTFDFGNLTSLFGNNTLDSTRNGTLEGIAAPIAALAGVPVAIKFSSLGIKGAIIGGLLGLKGFIVQVVITLLTLAFLISGTAYFVCNLGIVSCGGLGGSLGGGGNGHSGGGSSFFGTGPSASTPFGSGSASAGFSNPLSFFSSRTGVQQLQEQATPIYKAIDEGYKKYQ